MAFAFRLSANRFALKSLLKKGIFTPKGRKAVDIISIKTLYGPNVYHLSPVIIMKVNLDKLTDTSSVELPHLVSLLKKNLPGLIEHKCSEGHREGFYKRLNLGTYLGHILEHIAIELSQLAGIGVCFGKTVSAGEYGFYNIIVRFTNEAGMYQCLNSAFQIIKKNIFEDQDGNLKEIINQIKKIVTDTQLGISTQVILDSVIKRGIPFRKISDDLSLFQLGYGKNRKFFQASTTNNTSLISADIVQDKYLTKMILNRFFLPTPKGLEIKDVSELRNISEFLKPPFAIKPIDGNHGNGVVLNLICPVQIEKAFRYALKFSKRVLVEEMCFGKDYRILVIAGRFIAVAHRKPPCVTGDGKSTIQRLINQTNLDPKRCDGHSGMLSKLSLDEVCSNYLLQQNLTFETVLKKDQRVVLRGNANLSSGGTAVDVTEWVHPEIKALCERTARLLNLDICGIDLIHTHISLPLDANTQIIEVNAAPGLRMHLTKADGSTRDIGSLIIETLYPADCHGRIPIVAVTGTNGKTTVSRLIHHILSGDGTTVGLTSTDGIWIGDQKIADGDTTGPRSTEVLLSDPKVEVAVLELARGGLVRGGLAYDWSDVGIITNIRADHIGQDGIESIEDLIWIKSLVAERVRLHGTLVINADDLNALAVLQRPQVKAVAKNIFLYSVDKSNLTLNEHLIRGGSGCWYDAGVIYIKKLGQCHQFKADEIPITFNAAVKFQISNVLAAISACFGLGISQSLIHRRLLDFDPVKSNAGRLSLYQVNQGYVFLDYGHNPDALAHVSQIIQQFQGYKKTVVIGLPGDRSNELLIESAEALAGNFDHFIIKEDVDLRGRRSGEVSQILKSAIHKKNPHAICDIFLNEDEAIKKALNQITAKQIVVVFYDQLVAALKTLNNFDPVPVFKFPDFNLKNKKSNNLREKLKDNYNFIQGSV